MAEKDESNDINYKVVLLGDTKVGKTSILNYIISGETYSDPTSTIGPNYNKYAVNVENKTIYLQIWDTAGQEQYMSLTPLYLRGSKASVIVYDVTQQITFDNIPKWMNLLKQNDCNGEIFIVGNKIDMRQNRVIDIEKAQDFAKENKCHYVETSARTGENIILLVNFVATTLYKEKSVCQPEVEQRLVPNQTRQKDCCI